MAATRSIEPGTLNGVRDLGVAPSSLNIRVAIVLNYHHDAELEALTQAQADPDSPYFHHFLTSAQFNAYFAPTRAEYGRVLASLQRGGLTVTHTYPNRTVIDAVAPAPVMARYFGTDIHAIRTADGRTTWTNVRSGMVPAEIGDVVYHVVGLDAAGRMRPLYEFSRNARRGPGVQSFSPNSEPVFGADGGYGPLVFQRSYDFPDLNGFDGSGRASGVATDADFLDSDLSSFISYFGITRTGPPTQRVLVDGGPQPGDGPDSVETTLDVEQIVSLAPGTALYVYEVTYDEPTNGNFIDIYNQVVTDNKIDALNTSYGYCETAIHKGYPESLNAVAKQGNALGITFHSASGDGGSNWDGCNGVSVGAPVDIPHNTGVGGTTLSVTSQGQETNEVGWDGSGGGVSVLFAVPSYQKNVPTIISTGRNIPDVSYDADPGSGASFYYGGCWCGPIGGTSQASPIFGAALAETNQVVGARAGDFDVTLYRKWLRHGYSHNSTLYFRDITVGSIPPYSAGPGYDQMTGIGTMIVNNFDKLLK
ncbi:MAG TPA: S53 family peptidase [Candidatus Eremiobacteraceae bacterium]|nr:S53 family peptidase [Candidatus Eremiobacteraceae bacterium]